MENDNVVDGGVAESFDKCFACPLPPLSPSQSVSGSRGAAAPRTRKRPASEDVSERGLPKRFCASMVSDTVYSG